VSVLNSKERVLATLEHEEPDRVPLTDHIYRPESLERILGEPGVRVDVTEKYVEVHRLLSLDLIATYIDGGDVSLSLPEGSSGEMVDDWGIKWKVVDGMPWYIDGPLKTPEDFESFEAPDPYADKWFGSSQRTARLVRDDLATATLVEGPFTKCWYLTGLQTFMKALYLSPKSLSRLLDNMTRFQIELGKGFIDRGIDMIWLDEDLGDVKGPFMRPTLFRSFIKPRLKEMVDAFKSRGAKVLLHSDGQLMPLMDDIVETGIDGIHPIERAAGMNLQLMKTMYGDKLTLVGNVNSKTVLQYGPPEEIKKQVIECIDIAAPSGGYILASDHSIHVGIPSANVKHMFRAAAKYRMYAN